MKPISRSGFTINMTTEAITPLMIGPKVGIKLNAPRNTERSSTYGALKMLRNTKFAAPIRSASSRLLERKTIISVSPRFRIVFTRSVFALPSTTRSSFRRPRLRLRRSSSAYTDMATAMMKFTSWLLASFRKLANRSPLLVTQFTMAVKISSLEPITLSTSTSMKSTCESASAINTLAEAI